MARGYKSGGRKKGTPNKATGDAKAVAQLIRLYIVDIFKEYKDKQLNEDLMALSPKTRIEAITKLLEISSKISSGADKELLELFNIEINATS